MVELLCVKNKKCFLGEVCRLLHASRSVASEAGCWWQAARVTAAWLGVVLSRRGSQPWPDNRCPWRMVDVISSLVVVTHSQVLN